MGEPRQKVILEVDDNDAGRYAVARVLRAAGFDVREAATGEDALRMALERPDLVLLDVNLPGTNGFEILAKMKQVPALKATPVIMTTAEATRPAVMKGLVGGADGYLTKPLKSENLLKGVRTVLGLA